MPTESLIGNYPMCNMASTLLNVRIKVEHMLQEAAPKQACDLSVNFASDEDGVQHLAEYAELISQGIYFARYAYGYGYEYYLMWSDLFDSMPEQPTSLTVTSLGCGEGIDFWALRKSLRKHQNLACTRKLIGVDLADWSGCCIPFVTQYSNERESVWRWGEDAGTYLTSDTGSADGALESDVFVFPKSLNEFPDATIDQIASALRSIEPDHSLYLCICPPHDSMNRDLWQDEEQVKRRIDQLCAALRRDFVLTLIAKGETHRSDEPISSLADECFAPLTHEQEQSHRFGMGNLAKLCPSYSEDRPCRLLENIGRTQCLLGRAPLITGKYPCYRIYRFTPRP